MDTSTVKNESKTTFEIIPVSLGRHGHDNLCINSLTSKWIQARSKNESKTTFEIIPVSLGRQS